MGFAEDFGRRVHSYFRVLSQIFNNHVKANAEAGYGARLMLLAVFGIGPFTRPAGRLAGQTRQYLLLIVTIKEGRRSSAVQILA